MQSSRVLTVLLCILAPLGAVETRTWEQSEQADFERGTLHKLSLSSEGRLTPAPVVKEIFDASVTFLWSIARDSKGNVYAGGGGVGGSKAKLVQIDAGGKSKTFAQFDELAVQAVAIDRQDRVYAATSPDGKVYRVDASGKSEVFYDPKAKYIWALAFAKNGDLFVATGDQGEIHRVTPAGVGSVFYKTEEAHARSLAIDANDNLIAGTEPSGLILRISPAGQGFVLYEAPKREITAVAVAANGAIFAAGTGNKTAARAPAAPAVGRGGEGGNPNAGAPAMGGAPGGRGGNGPPPTANPVAGVPGGSEVYRIEPDGYARKIWNHAMDTVYALTFDGQGRAVIGTGNRGIVYRIDNDHSYTRLMNVAPAQVTAFCTAPGGKIFAATGNIGEVFSIGPEDEAAGTFESDVFDAGGFSDWGRLTALTEGAGAVTFETRSGNVSRAQKDWSPWSPLNAGRVASPAARFLQYRATITGAAELYEVATAYEMRNVAPVVEDVEVTPPNYKFPAPTGPTSAPTTLNLPPLGKKPMTPAVAAEAVATPAMTFAKGEIGARWLASDENGDALVFKVEIRGEGETAWKLLKEGLRDRYYSWDSTAFADGKYNLRVTASDAMANPPGQSLSSSRESDRFLIDNSPPEITGLTGTVNNGKIDVRFHAKDAWSILESAEYSVNGGDWKVVEPTTRLTDSLEHDYRFQVDRGQGEITIAVRVKDAYDNEAAAKTVVK